MNDLELVPYSRLTDVAKRRILEGDLKLNLYELSSEDGRSEFVMAGSLRVRIKRVFRDRVEVELQMVDPFTGDVLIEHQGAVVGEEGTITFEGNENALFALRCFLSNK